MSKDCPTQFMIMDACVLIDYINGEPELFKLISSLIGPIYVATPVLEEVDSIESVLVLEDFGLLPIEPEMEDVFEASEMVGRTSFQDNICFLTAKRQGLTCITNDRNLRIQCKTSGVPILWGLELILELVKTNGISKKKASHIAEEIHQSNPKHIGQDIIDRFQKQLDRI